MRCIQEENSEATKASMLDYLSNIKEESADFSWESAKVSHAVFNKHAWKLIVYSGQIQKSWIESTGPKHKDI